MGFANSSCSFTRFRILDAVSDELIRQIPDKLKLFAFHDIDELPEQRSLGWVCYDDMLDSEWQTATPFKGNYAVFSLRMDTRRIPPGVIKKHLAIALKDEKARLAQKEQKYIPRPRIKEIREQVLLRLQQRFLPVPAEFNTIWNLQSNEVWFASIQNGMIELFMETFLATFGLHLDQLDPYNLATALLGDASSDKLDSITPTSFINRHSGAVL